MSRQEKVPLNMPRLTSLLQRPLTKWVPSMHWAERRVFTLWSSGGGEHHSDIACLPPLTFAGPHTQLGIYRIRHFELPSAAPFSTVSKLLGNTKMMSTDCCSKCMSHFVPNTAVTFSVKASWKIWRSSAALLPQTGQLPTIQKAT